MTTRSPGGSCVSASRAITRSRRRTLLRVTALPTFLPTMNPNRAGAPEPSLTTCTTTSWPGMRRPRRIVVRKSSALSSRFARASTVKHREARLGRQFAAALATTSGEDRTAGAGAHAQTEAVHLGAAAVVRLEGSLAHRILFVLGGLLCRARVTGWMPTSSSARETRGALNEAEVNCLKVRDRACRVKRGP